MKRSYRRWVIGAAALALVGGLVVVSGVVPIKASAGHWAVTEWFLRFAMKRSIATHSLTVKVPENLADPELVRKGAGHYEIGCRSCHGIPGGRPPRIASRMLPRPPELVERIRDADARHLFYVVKHGIKLTGMPAWPSPHRDDEVWAMVAFLRTFPTLDAEAYQRLVRPETARETAAGVRNAPVPATVASCAGCHGTDGLGHGANLLPRLAGQPVEYLHGALEAYAAGRRYSGTMEPMAAGLTGEARKEITGYYSGLPKSGAAVAAPGAAAKADAAAIARGAIIARQGIPDQRLPACMECHGPEGPKRKPDYPLLAGQPAPYLQLQLTLFREHRRGGGTHAHLMQPIAQRLTEEQAREVGLFFESLGRPE